MNRLAAGHKIERIPFNTLMKTFTKPGRAWLMAVLMTLGLASAQAQTTANWIGPATGGEWNTGANWDTGFPPLDQTTNAFIGVGSNVNYSLPMASLTGFGTLTLNGVLNVSTNGFLNTGVTMIRPGGGVRMFITNGGDVNVTGTMGISSNAAVIISTGGSLEATTLQVGTVNSAGASGFLTNNGGNITATTTVINNNNASASSAMYIVGGTNNLGTININRAGPSSQPALGSEGLIVSNGLVNATAINVGGTAANSFLTMFVPGGIITNNGLLTVHLGNTASRPARYLQTGGLVVTLEPNTIFMNPSGNANAITVFSVTGGTNYTGGLQFGDQTGVNIGVANFTNAATMYIGAEGINSNGLVTLNASLNSGGLFGASSDWIGNAGMILNAGAFTFQAAADDGTAHSITLNGVLRGSGGLNKTGPGTLTLANTNTYTGITFVKNGTLALGTNVTTGTVGTIAGSSIVVGSGTTLDVSQIAPYSINSLQTIGGFGSVSGAIVVASGGIINPGSNAVTGSLTFNGDVTETNGAINHFDVPGDVVTITGTLTLSGLNTVEVSGSVPPGTPYAAIHYGTLNGDVGNLALSGATGTLSNSVTDKTIYVTVASSLRSNTNLVWVGNSTANDWDTHNLTNWVDANSSTLDFFLAGDSTVFNNTGGAHTNVNIPSLVTPAAVTVDSTLNYTFSGTGGINGSTTTLTKTNSGLLTVLTTNTYGGATVFGGGVLEVLSITNSTFASPLGASPLDPNFLVFNGGALRYSGDTASTDHGITVNTNGIIDVTNSATTLTVNGNIVGTGGLAKVGAGTLSLTGVNSYSGATSITNGVLTVNGATTIGANAINYAGGTLNLANSAVQQFYANLNNVITNSTIIQNGGNPNLIMSGGWAGSNVINFSLASGGTLTLNHDITTNFTGIMRMTDTSTGGFRFNSGGSATAAQQCNGSPQVVFDLGNGAATLFNRNGGGLTFGYYNLGALAGGPNTFLKGNGTGTTPANNSSFYNIGALNLDTTFAGTIADGNTATAVIKVGTGKLTLTGNNTYSGMTVISNGVIALGDGIADGSILLSTNINIQAGAFLDVSGRSDKTLSLNGIQVLLGNGTVLGSVLNGAGGTISPGGGIGGAVGTLTVTNGITVNSGSFLWMKLDRGSVPNSDRLTSPSINLDGSTLVVTNIGATLQPGDTFTLFNGPITGNIQTVVLPSYYTWNTNQLAVNGTISVVAANPPAMSADFSAFASSGTIMFTATNGIVGGPVSILSTTNVALPTAQWTVVTSGNFDGSGNFSAPVTVDTTAVPRQFFKLSAQ